MANLVIKIQWKFIKIYQQNWNQHNSLANLLITPSIRRVNNIANINKQVCTTNLLKWDFNMYLIMKFDFKLELLDLPWIEVHK